VGFALGLITNSCLADDSSSTTRGISGGNDLRGISGGNDLRGISGGNDLRGISGGNDLRGISGGNDLRATTFESIAIGPVDSVTGDGQGTTVSVLGQIYRGAVDLADLVSPGEYVFAAGNGGALGAILTGAELYVPGSTQVNVRGVIANVDPVHGTFSIGNVVVDYSSYLSSDPTFEPRANDSVEVSGIQPAVGGTIIASTILVRS
jgi:hypothetical protein